MEGDARTSGITSLAWQQRLKRRAWPPLYASSAEVFRLRRFCK
jgi:hypothetical protein